MTMPTDLKNTQTSLLHYPCHSGKCSQFNDLTELPALDQPVKQAAGCSPNGLVYVLFFLPEGDIQTTYQL